MLEPCFLGYINLSMSRPTPKKIMTQFSIFTDRKANLLPYYKSMQLIGEYNLQGNFLRKSMNVQI